MKCLPTCPALLPETVRVPPVAREQQQAYVLEGVAAQDDRARLLYVDVAAGVDVLDAVGVSVAVGQDADDAAVGPEVEVTRRQRLGDRGQGRVPLVVVEGTETEVPGRVRGRRVAVVRLAVHASRHRVRVQPHRLGRLAEGLSDPARAQRRQRVGFAARDEGVVLFSAGDADQVVERACSTVRGLRR